ncbi:MAG: PEP/pyruvate-binding domain-containing protein [Candidatus Sericytochromatia bacterium]|nr:PEP/pyruvate-binding domain-containing protein [Candidatus Sericytochromatia bacterium]
MTLKTASAWFASPEDTAVELAVACWGGKGTGLLRLVRAGFAVPEFVVIGADLFREWQRRGAPEPLDGELRKVVSEALASLPVGPLAVRSSAVEEDGDRLSLAGQFESFLGVGHDLDAVSAAVLGCWKSLHGERASAYRRRHGLSPSQAAMAVVVQVMVPADRALVLFTGNPINGDPDEVLVSSVWGLGDALVNGATEGDTDVLSRDGRLLRHTGGEQSLLRTLQSDGGVTELSLPAERVGCAVLGSEHRRAIHELAQAVRASFGRPMDVEAAFSGDQLLVLQARPITTPMSQHRMLWDNSNIVESYDGLTLPLTFSHASLAYRLVYTQFGRLLGVPRRIHDEHEREMSTYIGLHRGRVYYNLLIWYLSMAHLPGFSFTRSAMENMMGVRESLNIELPPAGDPLRKWTHDLPRLLAMVIRTGWAYLTLGARIQAFWARFDRVYQTWRRETFEGWETARLVNLYHQLVVEVLHHWEAPILTDVGAMVCMASLQRCVARWLPHEDGLVGALLVSSGEIESTEPTRRLMAIAQQVRQQPVAAALLTAEPADFLPSLAVRPETQPLAQALQAWLDAYGDRTMGELKLENPTPRDQPALIVPLLRNYVALPSAEASAETVLQGGVRTAAEARLAAGLKGRPVRAWWVRKLLNWTRLHVRNRENMRFARTRLTGVLRRLFTAAGRDLAAVGVISRAEDVFYLTVDELTALVDGRSVTRQMSALVELRRADYAGFADDVVPDRFVTRGLPLLYVPPAPTASDAPDTLQGTPCCAGLVEAATRCILNPQQDGNLNGEILVTARTDPGWVALYPAASGLLVEKGSVLSHSAIVAREMGLPTIVGVPGLCQHLADGQRVHMNGGTGTIRILSEETGA